MKDLESLDRSPWNLYRNISEQCGILSELRVTTQLRSICN